jgi:hypothetical protein
VSTTRDRVLAAIQAFRPRPIEVPELGGTIYLRPLTVAGFARLHRNRAIVSDAVAAARKALASDPGNQTLQDAVKAAEDKASLNEDRDSARMMADAIVDENGRQIFEGEAGEALLARLPANVAGLILDRISEAITMTASGESGAAGNLPATR